MIIYPDLDKSLVAYFSAVFPDSYVSVKKAAPDASLPDSQIIITATYTGDKEVVTRTAGVTIEVYSVSTFGESNTLALEVDAWLRQAITTDYIKQVTILNGPTRMVEDSGEEKRMIAAEVVVKALDY